MKLEGMVCPKCRSPLSFTDDKDYCFCSYCGTQVYKSADFTQNYTYRKVDEARIKEAEVKKEIEMAKLKASNRLDKTFLIYIICFAAFILIMLGQHFVSATLNERKGLISAGSYKDYTYENYDVVYKQFEAMGFTNIELVDLDDAGVLTGEVDTVKSVSIGGDDSFTDFDYFSKDEKVTIIYH